MASGRTGVAQQWEEFVDILEERRRGSDLGHAFRTYRPAPYRGAPPPCSTAELNAAVLQSHYLRYVAREVAVETGSSVEEVMEVAAGVVEEMSHKLQLGSVRLLGFTLSKVFKRIFSQLLVNMEGLGKLQEALQEHPVILMPNHRSYVDFLVISYILFTYDLPVPVIAAGVPLAGMALVGEILRRSGAFFIRRSIGTDKLYWAVLSEYVSTIVRSGSAPLEFYVEGLRSRTLKSLTPKLGMMHMVLEPFFKGQVYDITLVPISISYDRVLEEGLLAHELLGTPKPPETTLGLLRATRVLQENYGSMHVTFGLPLSVRQLTQGKVNRRQYNLVPRDLPQKPSTDTQDCVSWLAHLVLQAQEEGSVLSPWSLMACLLLQKPVEDQKSTLLAPTEEGLPLDQKPTLLSPTEEGLPWDQKPTLLSPKEEEEGLPWDQKPTLLSPTEEEGLPWNQLVQRTLWLRQLALDFGARLNWPEDASASDVMSSSMALHHAVARRSEGRVYLLEDEGPAGRRPISGEEEAKEGVARRAAAALTVGSYRNQTLHVFVRPALLATAMNYTQSTHTDDLLSYFSFLQEVFSNEFIFVPHRRSEDFQEACSLLRKCGAVHTGQKEVMQAEAGLQTTSFLCALLRPFIDTYQVVFSHLCEERHRVFSDKQFVPALRSLATSLILSGELHTYEALSSDTQKNALSALLRLGAVTKLRLGEHNEYRADRTAIRRIADILAGKIPPQTLVTAPDARL